MMRPWRLVDPTRLTVTMPFGLRSDRPSGELMVARLRWRLRAVVGRPVCGALSLRNRRWEGRVRVGEATALSTRLR